MDMARWSISSILDMLTGDLSSLDRTTSAKIRALSSYFLVLALTSPLLGIFYGYIGIRPLIILCLSASGLAAGGLIALRKVRNLEVMGNFGIFILWGLLILIRWHTGAMSAPGPELLAWVWNTVMILLAVYMTGFLWGSIWSCLVFVESGFAALLYKTGHHIPEVIPRSLAAAYGLGAYLLALLTVLLIAFLMEKERREMMERDQEQAEMIEGARGYVESLISKIPVPMFVVDRNHKVVQWNRACEELTGIPSNKILGKRVWKGFAVEQGHSFADELVENPEGFRDKHGDKVVSQSASGSFVLETSLPGLWDGRKVMVSTAPVTDSNGNIKGAIQCIQQVIMAQEAGEVDGFGIVNLEDSPCPIFVVDRNNKIILWNAECERRFGHCRELMEGRTPTNLVAKRFRKEFRDAISDVLRGETVSSKEFKYYNIDGEPVYVRAELYPRRDQGGKIVGCAVINTDITDLKVRAAMLQRALVQNREKLKKLTEEYGLLKRNIASFIKKKEGESKKAAPQSM